MSATNYVNTITREQADKLLHILEVEEHWDIDEAPYALFRARKNKTTCIAYESGKLVAQGKGTADLVQFTIEPRVLQEVRFGYEVIHAREENPEMFEPHAGLDESGKGDFFGPLVVACCYTDEQTCTELFDMGVQDSKNIKSDKRIIEFARRIREVLRGQYSVLRIRNEPYNNMYKRNPNVNKILAWAHSQCLENFLEKVPECPRALLDQFARNESTVTRQLQEKGKKIVFEQRTKAESDIAVAAASILAREAFVKIMDEMSEEYGLRFPKGASQQVLETAAELVKKHGEDILYQVAKTHFRTADQAIELAQSLQ